MRPLNILVVDDDPDLAEAICEALEMAGHNPTAAASGTEAIEKYCGCSFDITFMDVKLPDINGVEAFMAIREMDSTANVVMMTGYRIEQLLALATDNGAIKVLRKPFAVADIMSTLQEVFPAGLVLVADDDPDFAESAGAVLSENGYEVLIAQDGRTAIENAQRLKPDVLLLDLRLPVIQGLDVYLELKKRNLAIPTIIVTGYPKEESDAIDALRSLDVTGCLFKPFDPEVLLDAIRKLGLQEAEAQ